MNHPNKEIMQQAIELALQNYKTIGGHAVFAIIVKNDEVIAEAYATVNQEQDPTCHAEINAIKIAAKKLGSKKLIDCWLYTTYEPCPMCAAAAVWGRMAGIVYGASREDQNELNPWRVAISAREVIDKSTPRLELYENFMREECKVLLGLKP
jgi:guanine deaminase